jgi:hypothetical protein
LARIGERTLSHVLGGIAERNYLDTNLIITALITHDDSNEPGEGFYSFAQDLGLISRRTTSNLRFSFWVNQVQSLYEYYSPDPKAEV